MNDDEFFKQVNTRLWDDYKEESFYPVTRPLLAHYTSIQTFEKIVTTKKIWFSNPLFMNDIEEFRFGMNEGATAFYRSEKLAESCGSREVHEKLVSFFQVQWENFDSKHVLNTYLLCFSEHDTQDNDGLLSMWRGYGDGGSGTAIVIDTDKFSVTEGSPIILGKVHYASKKERINWIDQKLSLLADLISNHPLSDKNLFDAAWVWLNRLKIYSLFSKHNGFHEEREWRAVYRSELDTNGLCRQFFDHLATNKGVEPKLKLPIEPLKDITDENFSLEKIVDRIILGPSISSTLGVAATKQMLKNQGVDTLADRVVASDIPFRSTR